MGDLSAAGDSDRGMERERLLKDITVHPHPLSQSQGWDFIPTVLAPRAAPGGWEVLLGPRVGSVVTWAQGSAVVERAGLPRCHPALQAAPGLCGQREQGLPTGLSCSSIPPWPQPSSSSWGRLGAR